ncbi:MAG: ABC transporter permease [Thaumarchaeota archaeon]|nr:ABC transporter permease [Nitrososphaerota archaeon]
MHPTDIFSLSFDALVDRKVRTVLTVLMVVLGSSLVVVLNGLSAGQAEFLANQFSALAANVIYVGSGQHSYHGSSSPASIIINNAIVSKMRTLPYVEDVVPGYSGSAQIDSQGNTQRISITAMDPTKLAVILPNLQFVDGSTIKPNDPGSALVGDTIANPPGATTPFVVVGQTIKATYSYTDASGKQQQQVKNFIVSGVMQPSGNTRIDSSIVINLDAGNQLLHKSTKYDQIVVAAISPDYVDTVQQELIDQYGKTLGVTTPKSIMAVTQKAASGNAAFTLMVGIIALVVGAVGIVTTLYNSVTERIREIGTMKAIGAQNGDILQLFIVEAALIGIIGASLGIIIGMGAGYVLSIFTTTSVPGSGQIHIPPIYVPSDLLKVWLLSVTLSLAAGIYPAWKASRLSPMVALRRE